MQKNSKILNARTVFLLVFCFVIFISIGYSSYSSSLSISGSVATIRADKNVRVTGVSISNSEYGAESTAEDYDVNSIFSDVRLPNNNSTLTFEVEVKNYGNVEMGIESITLPSSLQSILNVSVSGYTLGDKIRDNNNSCEDSVDGCKLSIKRSFFVTLSYKDGAYNSNNYIFNNVILDFAFKEMHKVTYTGFTVLNPPIEARTVMDGHTFSYNIGQYDTLLVRVGGVTYTNYTIDNNNLLTIPNVTDDIEIIISEIMLPFVINTVPNGANIAYAVNGIDRTPATGTLNTEIAIGSSVDVTVSLYGYRTKTKNYTVNIETTDTITLDQVYYLKVTTDLDDATISYTVNGVSQNSVTKTLSDEYDPGTVIVATITRENYRTETRTYTMTEHKTETINMVRQYKYIANAVTPSVQNLSLSTNGGASQTITSGREYVFDTGTSITVVASASGYRTKTITHTIDHDIIDDITLTKTYIYTVGTVSPSNATLNLKVTTNSQVVYNAAVNAGDTYEADINSNFVLTASASGYRSNTYTKNNITSNYTQNVSLLKEYTFTLYLTSDVQVNTSISSVQPVYTLNNKTVSSSKTISSNKLSATITACVGDQIEYNITMPYFRNNASLANNTGSQTTTVSTSNLSASVKLYPNITSSTTSYNVIGDDNGLTVSRKSNGTRTLSGLPTYVTSVESSSFYLSRATNSDVILDFLVDGSSVKTWSPSSIGGNQSVSNIWSFNNGLFPYAHTFAIKLTNNQTIFGSTLRSTNYVVKYANP